jgi:methenyltetrahydromethanopterin cyclohydrolase
MYAYVHTKFAGGRVSSDLRWVAAQMVEVAAILLPARAETATAPGVAVVAAQVWLQAVVRCRALGSGALRSYKLR